MNWRWCPVKFALNRLLKIGVIFRIQEEYVRPGLVKMQPHAKKALAGHAEDLVLE